MSAYLHAFGAYLPERVVANAELAERVWLAPASGSRRSRESRSAGGRRRKKPSPTWESRPPRIASGRRASRRIPRHADRRQRQRCARFPGPAAEVAARLGMDSAPALDLPIASAGSLFGLALAMRLAETQGDMLVVAAEKMSALIETRPEYRDPVRRWRRSGSGVRAAGPAANAGCRASHRRPISRGFGVRWDRPAADERIDRDPASGAQDSRRRSRKCWDARIFPLSRSAVFLLHQANLNLLTRVAKSLGVGPEKVFCQRAALREHLIRIDADRCVRVV